MFARMAGCWQRAIYLASPDAEYWGVLDDDQFNSARNDIAELARAYGITVIDSTPMFEELRPYRALANHVTSPGSGKKTMAQ